MKWYGPNIVSPPVTVITQPTQVIRKTAVRLLLKEPQREQTRDNNG